MKSYRLPKHISRVTSVLSLALGLLTSFTVLGQEQFFNVGGGVALTASQIHGDGYGGYRKPGVQLGFFVNRNINKKFSFEFELNYSQRGSRKTSRPDKGDFTSLYIHLDYIDLPVLLRYDWRKWKFELGLSGGRLVNWTMRTELQGQSEPVAPFHNWDVNVITGANYMVNDRLRLHIRSFNSALPMVTQPSAIYFWQGWYNIVIVTGVKFQFTKSPTG